MEGTTSGERNSHHLELDRMKIRHEQKLAEIDRAGDRGVGVGICSIELRFDSGDDGSDIQAASADDSDLDS